MPGYLLGHPSVNLFRIPDACARANLDGRGKVVFPDAVIDEGATESGRFHNIGNSQKSTHVICSKWFVLGVCYVQAVAPFASGSGYAEVLVNVLSFA